MAGTISVDWDCVSDGKTLQGAIFKGNMQELLKAGYTVQIHFLDGSRGPTFSDSEKFGEWFDSI
ncbi:MAG: hypothetical protein ACKO0Z_03375 [Betaproteobacteria bacterium]